MNVNQMTRCSAISQDRRAIARAVRRVAALLVIIIWGIKLRRVRASVAEYQHWWAQPKGGGSGGLLYVALGDSAAQGIGASRPDRGYVGLIARRMQEATGSPVQVINLSRSGARVQDVVNIQMPRLGALQPDLVTVGVGGNDVRGYGANRFERDMSALVDALPAGTVIADMPYFMHGAALRHARQAAATVTRLAGKRGLLVAPLHETLRRRGWQAMATDYAADWFHPNDRGHRVWAAAFWDTIGPRCS